MAEGNEDIQNKALFEAMLSRFSSAIENIDDEFFEEENIDALRPAGIPFGIRGQGTAYIFRYIIGDSITDIIVIGQKFNNFKNILTNFRINYHFLLISYFFYLVC